ncbi:glutamate 5-kinase [Sulfurovum mangrovi]|uniref:glutamate 5-kinase n=1 Tax=Sulfurovum mangrovi TaxID=2893889 RepID=UPI001E363DDA|nr:glutamate 5-kinase [Sulfurovum mangrovi]UFH60084.1 glutamate 5-kinase [Sulfurovum mangrovi]
MQPYKRIVLKVGSSVLTEDGEIAKERMYNLVSFIAELRKKYEVVLVTSGAVSAGYTTLKLDKRKDISKKVLAAVGQPILMSSYKKKFDIYDVDTAQILLTEDDFDSRKRTEIFRQIINTSLEKGILPIVNENDISSTPDQLFGDNDQLAARVAHHTKSELLVILSDIDGYYDSNPSDNPDAKILKEVNRLTEKELQASHSPNNEFATGGIVTKLVAADFLISKGREMFLCSGFDLTTAKEYLLEGRHNKGTLFKPHS